MKKLVSLISLCFVLSLIFAFPALGVTLEQVQASPPRFDVYVYDDGADFASVSTSDISATLGDSKLKCIDLSQSDQGIFYFFMLDISGSIPAAHFNAAKNAVLETYAALREQDKLAVITFGNEVNLLLDGDEGEEEVSSALSALLAKDNKTMFYTAMDKLIETAAQAQDMRRIAVVVSDGIDDSDAGMTQSELEGKLINCGISVYALCIDSTLQHNVDNFRSFIKLSGGELYTFSPDSAKNVFDELLTRLGSSYRITLTSTDAIPSDSALDLNVSIGSSGTVSARLSPSQWIPDSGQPYIKSATYSLESKTLEIVFSEPVDGGDNTVNYVLKDGANKAVSFASAEYTSDSRTVVSLKFGDVPLEGQYVLSVSGITDMSAAKNALHPYTSTLHLATGVVDSGEAASDFKKDIITYIIVGILAIALIAGMAFAIVKLSKTEGKNKSGAKLSTADKKKIKKVDKGENRENKRKEKFVFTNVDGSSKRDKK